LAIRERTYPARLLLTYMLDVVHILASLPSVLVHRSISLPYMLCIYAIVAFVLAVTYKKLPKSQPVQLDSVQVNTLNMIK
jgi:hypothetical protein